MDITRRSFAVSLLALSLAPAVAGAGVSVNVSIGWEAPPVLVEVSPGVQVVEDYDEEVFFSGEWYWVERDGLWYRTKDHHGHWVVCEREHVPAFIVKHPRGAYRHWKHVKEEVREERHEEKREEKREEKHEKHEKKHK